MDGSCNSGAARNAYACPNSRRSPWGQDRTLSVAILARASRPNERGRSRRRRPTHLGCASPSAGATARGSDRHLGAFPRRPHHRKSTPSSTPRAARPGSSSPPPISETMAVCARARGRSRRWTSRQARRDWPRWSATPSRSAATGLSRRHDDPNPSRPASPRLAAADAERSAVVHVIPPGQAAEHGLARRPRHTTPRVLALAAVRRRSASQVGQAGHGVQFSTGRQSGGANDAVAFGSNLRPQSNRACKAPSSDPPTGVAGSRAPAAHDMLVVVTILGDPYEEI